MSPKFTHVCGGTPSLSVVMHAALSVVLCDHLSLVFS